MRLSHFDPKGPLDKIPASTICSEEAKATARDATAQSIALLKNDDGILPLSAPATKSVAVIGPNAVQPWSITSYYGPSTSCDMTYFSTVDAVRQYVCSPLLAEHQHQKGVFGLSPSPACLACGGVDATCSGPCSRRMLCGVARRGVAMYWGHFFADLLTPVRVWLLWMARWDRYVPGGTVYDPGLPDTLSYNTSGIKNASDTAKAADYVVLVLGTDLSA